MKRIFAVPALASLPAPAFAAWQDTTYYTYGEFQMAVDALKRVALYYSADNAWIIAIFAAGILAAAIVHSVSDTKTRLSGGQSSSAFLGSLGLSIIGLMVFSASVGPKSTVHVYDNAKNKYEAVDGVPAIIAVTAGGISSALEAFRDTENTANAYTYGTLADASPFTMMKEALLSAPSLSSHLITNINQLYMDCGSAAITSGQLDINTFRSGTYDLLDTLSALRHNSIQTEIYSDTHPYGISATCTDAYDSLVAQLSNPAIFDPQLINICEAVDLDIGDASQKSKCLEILTNSFDIIYANKTNQVDWKTGLQNLLIGEVVAKGYKTASADALNIEMSRNNISGAMGAMEATARYMPVMKGVVLSAVIGLAPVLLMFIVTPLIGAALKLYFGLFGFYTIWLMCDMVVLSAIEDQLFAATTILTSNKMGLLSVWNTQSAIIDSFSALGTSRTISITLAVILSTTLFKVSAYALAGVASKAEQDFETEGNKMGQDLIQQENAGEQLDSLVSGNASFAAYGSGLTEAARPAAMSRASEIRSGNLTADTLGGLDRGATALAEHEAAQASGQAIATRNEGFERATELQTISQEGQYAQSAATDSVAGTVGASTRDLQQSTAEVAQGKEAGEASEIALGSGLIANALNQGRDQGARGRAVAEEVEKHGTDEVFTAARQGHEREVEDAQAIEQLTPNSRNYFADTATRETSETLGMNRGSADYTPDEIEVAKAGDYTEEIQSSLTKTNEAGEVGVSRAELASGQATAQTHDEMAEQNLRDSLMKTLGVDDAAMSAMALGSNTYNLSRDKAETAYEAGILNDQQLMTARQEGAVVLDLNAAATPEGELDVFSTKANYSESTESDKSAVVNESVQVENSMASMDPNSARMTFSDAGKLGDFIGRASVAGLTEREINTEVGVQSSQGLEGLVSFSETDETIGSNSILAHVSADAGLVGDVFGVNAGVQSNNEKSDVNNKGRTEDIFAMHAANVYGSIDDYYDRKVEAGEMKPQEAATATFEAYAGYYSEFKNNLANGEVDEFNRFIVNGELDNVWEDYNERNNLGIDLLSREETFDEQHYEELINEQEYRQSLMEHNEEYLNNDVEVSFPGSGQSIAPLSGAMGAVLAAEGSPDSVDANITDGYPSQWGAVEEKTEGELINEWMASQDTSIGNDNGTDSISSTSDGFAGTEKTDVNSAGLEGDINGPLAAPVAAEISADREPNGSLPDAGPSITLSTEPSTDSGNSPAGEMSVVMAQTEVRQNEGGDFPIQPEDQSNSADPYVERSSSAGDLPPVGRI